MLGWRRMRTSEGEWVGWLVDGMAGMVCLHWRGGSSRMNDVINRYYAKSIVKCFRCENYLIPLLSLSVVVFVFLSPQFRADLVLGNVILLGGVSSAIILIGAAEV